MISAKQILAQKPVSGVLSIAPNAMVIEAVQKMAKESVGALVVMENSALVGIFSERDYARRGIIEGNKSQATPVSDLMTKKVITVLPDTTIQECMKIMSERRIRHLPIVNNQKTVLGLLSIGDIVNAILNEQQAKIKHLENYLGRRW